VAYPAFREALMSRDGPHGLSASFLDEVHKKFTGQWVKVAEQQLAEGEKKQGERQPDLGGQTRADRVLRMAEKREAALVQRALQRAQHDTQRNSGQKRRKRKRAAPPQETRKEKRPHAPARPLFARVELVTSQKPLSKRRSESAEAVMEVEAVEPGSKWFDAPVSRRGCLQSREVAGLATVIHWGWPPDTQFQYEQYEDGIQPSRPFLSGTALHFARIGEWYYPLHSLPPEERYTDATTCFTDAVNIAVGRRILDVGRRYLQSHSPLVVSALANNGLRLVEVLADNVAATTRRPPRMRELMGQPTGVFIICFQARNDDGVVGHAAVVNCIRRLIVCNTRGVRPFAGGAVRETADTHLQTEKEFTIRRVLKAYVLQMA
jgi:hypothetical protein